VRPKTGNKTSAAEGVVPITITRDSESTPQHDISPITNKGSEDVSDPTVPSNLADVRDKEASILAILDDYFTKVGGWKHVNPMATPRVSRTRQIMDIVSTPIAIAIEKRLLKAVATAKIDAVIEAAEECFCWGFGAKTFTLCTLADMLITECKGDYKLAMERMDNNHCALTVMIKYILTSVDGDYDRLARVRQELHKFNTSLIIPGLEIADFYGMAKSMGLEASPYLFGGSLDEREQHGRVSQSQEVPTSPQSVLEHPANTDATSGAKKSSSDDVFNTDNDKSALSGFLPDEDYRSMADKNASPSWQKHVSFDLAPSWQLHKSSQHRNSSSQVPTNQFSASRSGATLWSGKGSGGGRRGMGGPDSGLPPSGGGDDRGSHGGGNDRGNGSGPPRYPGGSGGGGGPPDSDSRTPDDEIMHFIQVLNVQSIESPLALTLFNNGVYSMRTLHQLPTEVIKEFGYRPVHDGPYVPAPADVIDTIDAAAYYGSYWVDNGTDGTFSWLTVSRHIWQVYRKTGILTYYEGKARLREERDAKIAAELDTSMLSNWQATERRKKREAATPRPSPIATSSDHDGDDPRWNPPSRDEYDDKKYLELAASMGVTPKSIPTQGLPSKRSISRTPTSFFPSGHDDRSPYSPYSSDTKLTDAQAFLKGRKRTVDNYTYRLRSSKDWRNVKMKLQQGLLLDGCADVISADYKVETVEERDAMLFKMVYVYEVLDVVFIHYEAKQILDKFRRSGDARAAWMALTHHYETSSGAVLWRERLLTNLFNFADNNQPKTYMSYLKDFTNLAQEYDDANVDDLPMSDPMKKKLLERAVAKYPALADMKKFAMVSMATSGRNLSKDLSYNEYYELLEHAAGCEDEKLSRTPRGAKRQGNFHDLEDQDDKDDKPSLEEILAKIHNRLEQEDAERLVNKSAVKADVWYSLSDEDRAKVDSISDRGKSFINGSLSPEPKYPEGSKHKADTDRKVNFAGATEQEDEGGDEETDATDDDATTIIANLNKQGKPGSIDRLLGNKKGKGGQRTVKKHQIVYKVSANAHKLGGVGALVDRGANGGIVGSDARLISATDRKVSVTGIDNHHMTNLQVGTYAAVVRTQMGEVIVLLHEYANDPNATTTIHSTIQLEDNGIDVSDKARLLGGNQCIKTLEGHVIPLNLKDGLFYMKMRPPTDKEYAELEHVHLTKDIQWDPSKYDDYLADDERWYKKEPNNNESIKDSLFDRHGELKNDEIPEEELVAFSAALEPMDGDQEADDEDERYGAPIPRNIHCNKGVCIFKAWEPRLNELLDEEGFTTDTQSMTSDEESTIVSSSSEEFSEEEGYDDVPLPKDREPPDKRGWDPSDFEDTRLESESEEDPNVIKAFGVTLKREATNVDELRDYFLRLPATTIERTLNATTSFVKSGTIPGITKQKWFNSPHPSLNVTRRNEPVATDTIYSSVPAFETGHQHAQIFVGRISRVIDLFSCRTDGSFAKAFQDVIRKRGAMDKLISDRARAETSKLVKDILRTLHISDWQSEPHTQWQNYAERVYQIVKSATNRIIARFGVYPEFWFHVMEYVAYILNRTAVESLGWRTPLETLTGQTPDISVIKMFRFWEPVYYQEPVNAKFPKDSAYLRGRFVGFADSVGSDMTFKVYDEQRNCVLFRGHLVSALDPANRNFRADRIANPEDPEKDIREFAQVVSGKYHPGYGDVDIEGGEGIAEVVYGNSYVIDSSEIDKEVQKRKTEEQSEVKKRKTSRRKDHGGTAPPTVETVDEEEPVSETDEDAEELFPQSNDGQDTDGKVVEEDETPLPMKVGDKNMPTIDLVGRNFLGPVNEEEERHRLIIREVLDEDKRQTRNSDRMQRFRCENTWTKQEEIITRAELCDLIEDTMTNDGEWKFERVIKIRKRPKPGGRKSQKVEMALMQWSSGERTWSEVEDLIKQGHQYTLIEYAESHPELYRREFWKKLRPKAKNIDRVLRMANQARLRSFRDAPRYKYGVEVPRDHDYQHALELDEKYGHHKWRDAADLEMSQMAEYEAFIALPEGSKPPKGYHKIKCHLVWDVKHDGRHKARFVAGGHLTPTPVESVYSGVVSLRGVRAIAAIAVNNDLELWSTDIGNAYLESYTSEKVYFIAGAEFGELKGRIMVVNKACYGLRFSGKNFHDKLFDILKSEGFTPSHAEPDIWMRRNGDFYEYIGVYVDDLQIASKNPQGIIDMLEQNHKFKLKGTGPLTFHLGCDFIRDEEGYLCMAPKKYIQRMVDNFEMMFGYKPTTKYRSPLEKNDHPELDDTPELDPTGVRQYQSLIGSLQWAISLGRFDIATAVSTLSRFRAQPTEGHLERAKRVVGYLAKFSNARIRFNMDLPDYSDLVEPDVDWARTVYGDVKEVIPDNIPEPLGKPVVLTTYFDANLYHDMITGRSMTGILHFVNGTPFDWHAKKQNTVETATYGSEYVAGRTAVEQVMEIRNYFRYLGVPVLGKTRVFGDNESMIKSSTLPHSVLTKRHNAISYHKVREAVASDMMSLHHIPGTENPSDILSKHWAHCDVWPMLQKILFWYRDRDNPDSDDQKGGDKISVTPSKG
jgi:hypothetical protein